MMDLTPSPDHLIDHAASVDHARTPATAAAMLAGAVQTGHRCSGANRPVTLPPDVPSRAFGSYCGTYSFDGMELITHVDGASTPELFVDQVRHVRFEGPTRMKINPVSGALGDQSHFELVWERVG